MGATQSASALGGLRATRKTLKEYIDEEMKISRLSGNLARIALIWIKLRFHDGCLKF